MGRYLKNSFQFFYLFRCFENIKAIYNLYDWILFQFSMITKDDKSVFPQIAIYILITFVSYRKSILRYTHDIRDKSAIYRV